MTVSLDWSRTLVVEGDVMLQLPTRPDFGQLRNKAKDLLRAAKEGHTDARGRIEKVSDTLTLASAQLALAREYGFDSWSKLKVEVERRRILDDRDLDGLASLLTDDPDQASTTMEHWCDHPLGASPLSYVAMLRFDTSRLRWRDVTGTAEMASALIAAGAPVDGALGDLETPLITAASYGDARVAKVLIEAGADVEAVAAAESGGIPGGTALVHATWFGMTEVVDVLVETGAKVNSLLEAAAGGDITGWLKPATPLQERIKALVIAADHQRLDVIDQLIASPTPVDATDTEFGRQPLRTAASNGRPSSVRRLLDHGADPNLRDPEHGRTPLDWCQHNRYAAADPTAHDEVKAILEPITTSSD